jgi:hypothetical protein
MFNCPYALMDENSYRAEARNSYVRVLHASPNAPPVDIYANEKRLVRNFPYKEFSEYLPVPPGNYNIRVYPAGKRINPLIDTSIRIMPATVVTLAAIGLLPNISLFPIFEPIVPRVPGRACIRVVHLSPDTPAIDLTRMDGRIIFSNVKYKGITDYVCISSGGFGLQLRLAGTDQVILTDPYIRLMPNKHYSIFVVGTSKGTEPLQILIALDGSSYIPR